MGHLGDIPARPLPPTVNVIESTAPTSPPRLDEPGVALAPIPPTVTPPPPASSCPEPEQKVETQNSKAKPSARPKGLGAFLLARSRERARELDHMSREEIINLYTMHKRSKNNNKLTTPDLQKRKRCGLKRRDTGGACHQLLTKNREAHKMSREHGNVTVVCPYCNCQMLQVTYYQRHGRQCQELSGEGSSEFIMERYATTGCSPCPCLCTHQKKG